MALRLSALTPLVGSIALHAVLVVVVARSARGAEPPTDEQLAAATFVGNTFEIEELLADGELASEPTANDAAAALPTPSEALASPPETEALPPESREPEPPHESAPEADAPALAPEPEPPNEESTPEPEPVVKEVTALPPPLATKPIGHQVPAKPTGAEAPSPSSTTPASASKEAGAERLPAVAASSQAASEAAPSNAALAPSASGAAWGQSALPAGVTTLAKGFTRAMPGAAFRERIWHELPLGAAGKITFSVELNDEGKVLPSSSKVDEKPTPPAYLKGLVERTLLMLRIGRFALNHSGLGAGTQRFELSATIVQGDQLDDGVAKPRDLRQIGRQVEPTASRPGKANFTYNSGRQVQLSIRIIDN